MSSWAYILSSLLMMAIVVSAQEEFDEVDSEGRTFGHLAKPLKKLTKKLGHYLIHASSDYPYQYQHHQAPLVHHNNYGGYYEGYNNVGFGYHRPGFLGGYGHLDF